MTLCLECSCFMSAPFQKPRITPVDTKGVQELLGNEAKYKATPVNYKNSVSSYIDPASENQREGEDLEFGVCVEWRKAAWVGSSLLWPS